jgi:threonine dehydratase
MKIVVEPTGCLGLAGLLIWSRSVAGKEKLGKGKKVGVIVSGGNVDLKRFAKLILESKG